MLETIEKTLNTLEAGFVSRSLFHFRRILREAKPIVESCLKRKDAAGFVLPGGGEFTKLLIRFLQEGYAQGVVLADEEIERKNKEYRYGYRLTGDPVVPQEALSFFDQWTAVFGVDYYNDMTADAVKVMQQAIAEGASIEQTMTALDIVFTGRGFGRQRLETIARTNTTSAFNVGRMEWFTQNSDFVRALEFNAILDPRTTEICEERHGKILLIDDPLLAENTPPMHYNCRSILSPVIKPEWEQVRRRRNYKLLRDWSAVPPAQEDFGRIWKRFKSGIVIPQPIKPTPKPKAPKKEVAKKQKSLAEMEIEEILKPGVIPNDDQRALRLGQVMFENFLRQEDIMHYYRSEEFFLEKVRFETTPGAGGCYQPNIGKISLASEHRVAFQQLSLGKKLTQKQIHFLDCFLHEMYHSYFIGNTHLGAQPDYIRSLDEGVTDLMTKKTLLKFLKSAGFKISKAVENGIADLGDFFWRYGYQTNRGCITTLWEKVNRYKKSPETLQTFLLNVGRRSFADRKTYLTAEVTDYFQNYYKMVHSKTMPKSFAKQINTLVREKMAKESTYESGYDLLMFFGKIEKDIAAGGTR